MSESQPTSPRSRLQALLAVPERSRTDAQWDEINELEIMLAPGNREGAPEPNVRRAGGMPQQGQGRQQQRPGGGGLRGKKQGKKFQRRPPRGNMP